MIKDHNDRPTLIEQSSKKWKALQALGGVVMGIGILWFMAASANGARGSTVTACVVTAVGLVTHLWGRIAAWWETG